MPGAHPTTAVSAPGKVLLAGGYLVLDRSYTGLVFGLSARINVIAQEISTSPGVQLTEIVVESPQFLEAQWRYGYHLADEDGGMKITQLHVASAIHPNPFIETALAYALTYITLTKHQRPTHSMTPARLTILADNDYYSQPASTTITSPGSSSDETITSSNRAAAGGQRFAPFPTTLSGAHKTGLGSSAALVTALTAALLTHYLHPSLFDVVSARGKTILHNLAQAAHCTAQGKVGSGFDVAAAVYGSCRYRRFSPTILSSIPQPGAPGFGTALEKVVGGGEEAQGGCRWDTEVVADGVGLPDGVVLRMCDVDCGSATVGMVKKVLGWREREGEAAKALWDGLQGRNEALDEVLRSGKTGELPGAIKRVRELVRKMGRESDAPIEPESQTELLDALGQIEGVYGGVVPGAGGYDALALLVKDDEETTKRIEGFLEQWSKGKEGRVRLLAVKGEMEGVRMEKKTIYEGWLH